MLTYRIYYAERELKDRGTLLEINPENAMAISQDYVAETEWEEEVEARNAGEALEAFFRDHVKDRSEVRIVEEDGRAQPLSGVEDFDHDRTYIWIEGGKLMEYQGLDEATPGMVPCPLCNGHGEVPEDVAEEFAEVWGEEEGMDTDVRG